MMSSKRVMLEELSPDHVKTSRHHCSEILRFTLLQDVLPAAAFSRSAMLCGRPERVNTCSTVQTNQASNTMQILRSAGLQCHSHCVHTVNTDMILNHLVNERMLKLSFKMCELYILALTMHLYLILESKLTKVADCAKHGPHP